MNKQQKETHRCTDNRLQVARGQQVWENKLGKVVKHILRDENWTFGGEHKIEYTNIKL